jgi:hypothetical protein
MIDISAVKAKEREKAHAAKFAASWNNSEFGDAGVEKTRREPAMLSDRQCRTLDQFAALVPKSRRSAYSSAVLARLSGSPGDAAVHSASVNAALDGYLSNEELSEAGLISINARGYVRPQPERGPSWQSRAIRGVGR